MGSLDNYEAESHRVLHFAANLELGCANIGHNDSMRKLARQSEASTADSTVGSASGFVGRLDDFAAFAPDYKPDLISTDKSRTTSTCCIGGRAATTCEVTEEAASRKVNVVFSSESSVLINDPGTIADNVSWAYTFTGGFSCQGQSQED